MSTSLAGSTIGRFRVDRLLGQGGMGAVYAAFDEKLERDVALKVLHDEGEAPAQRKRLLREARIAAKLQHPNIATIYEVEELEGVLYIVMELLEGVSLRRALMDRRLNMEEAIGVARDMARGLAKAHAAGVVHRDIKPENIFLTALSADTVLAKVLDFGLARQKPPPAPGMPQHEHTSTNTTSRGDMWGTPGYVSPEQALGQQVDARTDLFSFGVVVYEMLSNVRPFRGETAVATMIATTRQEPRPLLELVPHLPPAMDEIITRCLKKRREERYNDAAELSAALDAFMRGGPSSYTGRASNLGSTPRISTPEISVAPSVPFVPVPEAPTTGSAAISMTTREETLAALEERRRDRVKLIAAVSVGLALALVALGLILMFGLSAKPPPIATAGSATASASSFVAPPEAVTAPEPPAVAPPPETAATLETPPEPPPAETVAAPAETVAAPAAPAPHPRPPPKPAPAPVGSNQKKKPADCVQPFVIDSKGVRIPKLHCL